jgi:hypothetical protein
VFGVAVGDRLSAGDRGDRNVPLSTARQHSEDELFHRMCSRSAVIADAGSTYVLATVETMTAPPIAAGASSMRGRWFRSQAPIRSRDPQLLKPMVRAALLLVSRVTTVGDTHYFLASEAMAMASRDNLAGGVPSSPCGRR